MRKVVALLVALSAFTVGASIAAPQEEKTIQVDKTYHVIVLQDETGKPVKVYPIGTGRVDKPTKEGLLKIIRKIVDPSWMPLNTWDFEDAYGKTWPFPPYSENRRNPLGSRFMHLSWEDYGIHGTKEPLLIGRNVSSGCVRMNITDVEELFVMVPVGTYVNIKPVEDVPDKLKESFSSTWGIYDILNLAQRKRAQKGEN
ncbi:MAG: L,D-transpeptidase [Caldisericales bacterium]|nr:L,D-transpeptidase [Caldisericia bacterium]MBP6929133.1 L,D-transpeptidase [Caldisericia bacterium]NMD14280.1 L,D-transpeptidase [Caldisericales bacterium]